MTDPPSLKFVASTVCTRVLLLKNGTGNDVAEKHATYLTSLFETGCFTAVSEDIFIRILKYHPEDLSERLLKALVPSHVRELSLEGCTNVQLMGLVRTLKKCSHMHTLNLTQCSQLIHPDIFTFIGLVNLPLTTLILEENNNVTDEVVQSVLKNAPNLITLNISCCRSISNKVFLVDEDVQLMREVSPNKSEEAYDCNLTNIDISGCRQLDSTAVKHLISLCGPKLKCVDLSYTSCDCIALLYLAGYSLPAILDILLTNDDLQSDSEIQSFLQQYREIRDLYIEQYGTPLVSTLKPIVSFTDTEKHNIESMSDKNNDINSDCVEDLPEGIPDSNTFKDVSECHSNIADKAESELDGLTGRSECTGTLVDPETDNEYCDINDALNTSVECVVNSIENKNEIEKVHQLNSSKGLTNTVEDGHVEHTLRYRIHDDDTGMNTCSKVGASIGLEDECRLADDFNSDLDLVDAVPEHTDESALNPKTCKNEHFSGEQLQSDTTNMDKATSRNTLAGETYEATTQSASAGVTDKATSHNTSAVNTAGLDDLKADVDRARSDDEKCCDKCFFKHETRLYNPHILSLTLRGIKFVGRSFKLGQICLEKFLEVNPCLQKLSISWKGLTPEYFQSIASKLADLRDVTLEECTMLQNEGVTALGVNCQKCVSVNLRGVVFFSDSGLVPLLSNKNLQHFNLAEGTSISDKILTLISERLNQSLISLDLSWCEGITEEGINTICSTCPNLKKLHLTKCPVSDTSIKLLAETCKELQELSAQTVDHYFDDQLTDEGILTLAHNFKYLRVVEISWNLNVEDMSICALMKNCGELEEAIFRGLKGITELPFRPIISGYADENSEEADTTSHLPCRSTVYARNLHNLDLDCSDFVNDVWLQRIVDVCRGTLHVTDYYGQKLVPS